MDLCLLLHDSQANGFTFFNGWKKNLKNNISWHLKIIYNFGNSLVVQWLGLCALTAEGLGSIPGQETKIPQAIQCSQKQNNIIYNSSLCP